MKRCRSSTSVIDAEREKQKGVVYAVFEDYYGQYFIYELGSVEGSAAGEDKGLQQQPIETLKSLPADMFFFSVDSKLYLCGGMADGGSGDESLKAYMFDINSKNNGIVSIDSMKSPKPQPLVSGPVDDHKFYIFSEAPEPLNHGLPSFEMFDTNTNRWESLFVPSYLSGLYFSLSALCASNIFLYTESIGLVVFCVRTGVWGKLPLHCPDHRLPRRFLFDKGHFLFCEDNIHYILTSGDIVLPRVYSIKKDDLDLGPVATVHKLGQVDGFLERLKELDEVSRGQEIIINSFSLNDNSTMCIVRTEKNDSSSYEHFGIDIFDVRYVLMEDRTKVKVEVENTLKYKYRSKSSMLPRHFLVLFA